MVQTENEIKIENNKERRVVEVAVVVEVGIGGEREREGGGHELLNDKGLRIKKGGRKSNEACKNLVLLITEVGTGISF